MRPVLPHVAMALVTVAALAAPATPPARAAEPPSPTATIIEVSGPVTWHAGGETVFKEARGGELLFAGAIVRTGARGNARLKWRNGGDFRLMPLSEIFIPEDEGVLLNAGKVWAQFKDKLLAPFYFKSPSATAVVRGTILGVELNPDTSTTVEVLEGRVEVTSARGGPSRMIEPGQSLIVSPFGVMGPIQPVDPGMRMFEHSAPGMPPSGQPGSRPDRGPERGPGQRPGAFDWLRNNRASVRLEPMRQEERSRRDMRLQPGPAHGQEDPPQLHPGGPRGPQSRPPRGPGMRMRPGDPTDRQPVAVDPQYAFPAGRPPGPGMWPPYCDPATLTAPTGTMPECPPPPEPSGARPLPPPPPPPPPPGVTP